MQWLSCHHFPQTRLNSQHCKVSPYLILTEHTSTRLPKWVPFHAPHWLNPTLHQRSFGEQQWAESNFESRQAGLLADGPDVLDHFDSYSGVSYASSNASDAVLNPRYARPRMTNWPMMQRDSGQSEQVSPRLEFGDSPQGHEALLVWLWLWLWGKVHKVALPSILTNLSNWTFLYLLANDQILCENIICFGLI